MGLSSDRTPQSFSQSLGDLRHRDGNVGFHQMPMKPSWGVFPHSNVNILLNHSPKDAINMQREKTVSSQAQPQSADILHQDSPYVFRHHDQADNIAMFSDPATDASTVTLDEAGYQQVAALCCADDMRTFVRRVAVAESYMVCDEGGLSGLLWWYDCSDDQMSYANLVASIKAASTSACKWVS